MNWFKSHWKQLLTVAASIAVGVSLHFGKLSADEATMIGGALALIGIHLSPIVYGARFAAKQAVLDAAKKIGPAVVLVLGCALLAAPTTACTKAQANQVKDIVLDPNAAQCVEEAIGDVTGNVDIAGTIAHCGVTIEQLVAYLEEYFSTPADAGPDAAPALGASPAKLQHVGKWLDAAKAYQAAHR